METRVVIFEDNEARREGLEVMINMTDGICCVGTFHNCKNVEEDIRHTEPDLVLMDINMPVANGIEGVKRIRKINTKIKILMQTVFEDDTNILASICAGADGYVLKKVPPHELILAIQQVMNGGASLTPVVARQVMRFLQQENPVSSKSDFDLTSREHEILSLLVQGNSYKMIAAQCNISTATVNSHIQHIYEKLQVHSVVEAVTKAIKNNIV